MATHLKHINYDAVLLQQWLLEFTECLIRQSGMVMESQLIDQITEALPHFIQPIEGICAI